DQPKFRGDSVPVDGHRPDVEFAIGQHGRGQSTVKNLARSFCESPAPSLLCPSSGVQMDEMMEGGTDLALRLAMFELGLARRQILTCGIERISECARKAQLELFDRSREVNHHV